MDSTEDEGVYIYFSLFRVCDEYRSIFFTDFANGKEFDDLVNEEYPICRHCCLT